MSIILSRDCSSNHAFHSPFQAMMVMSTGCSPLKDIDDNDNKEEDRIILLGCKLIVSAAGVIGSQRHHQISSQAQREQIYRRMGDRYFRRRHRMNFESFCLTIEGQDWVIKADEQRVWEKRGCDGGNYSLPSVRSGPITTSVRLACAICFLQGEVHMTSWESMRFCIWKWWKVWAFCWCAIKFDTKP